MAEQHKVALVTGSALNIGRATALALARDGYRVMMTARSSAADCARTAKMIGEAGGEAVVHLADISDAKQARGLVEAVVTHFGRLDVLVNNASIRRQTKFSELTVEEWREILGATLDGAFYCAHAAAPHILAAGGNTGRASLPDNLAGRQGKPEEIAEMVRYLCSPAARFITGQTIHVNGGAFMP